MSIETARRPLPAESADRETVGRSWSLTDRNQIMLLLHPDEVPSGQLLDVLADRGLEAVVVRGGESDEQLPDPKTVSVAVLLGSGRFGDIAGQEWFGRELDWLRQADRAGATVLGIGHGARALAIAFGGGVEPAHRPNRGWTMVATSVPHRIAGGPWLSWQHDVISLPPRAELLAYNRFGPQAFRVGRHLAIQFHPEATPRTVTRWVASSDDALDPGDVLAATSRDAVAADVCAHRLFSAFIDTRPAG